MLFFIIHFLKLSDPHDDNKNKEHLYLSNPPHDSDYNTEKRTHRLNRKFYEKIQETFFEGYRPDLTKI